MKFNVNDQNNSKNCQPWSNEIPLWVINYFTTQEMNNDRLIQKGITPIPITNYENFKRLRPYKQIYILKKVKQIITEKRSESWNIYLTNIAMFIAAAFSEKFPMEKFKKSIVSTAYYQDPI